jgi:hypothetical protein
MKRVLVVCPGDLKAKIGAPSCTASYCQDLWIKIF